MPKHSFPRIGSPAPFFRAPALSGNRNYAFDTCAGRAVLLLFLGSGAQEASATALNAVQARRPLFDDTNACFFGVTVDPSDETSGRISQDLPGIRYFLDYDMNVSKLFGALDLAGEARRYHPHWLVLDRALRIAGRYALEDSEAAFGRLSEVVAAQSRDAWAPVLEVPEVFEPTLCERLIRHYEEHGGEDSGFMREIQGKTVGIIDHTLKRRSDAPIDDTDLIRTVQERVAHRIRPMVRRAFHFDASRMERYIVACYDAQGGGHFRPHRDNTTQGTAHRRFAVTINLNTGDYTGGGLRFPEYGNREYHASKGGAIVFSCSLLHEALPVLAGRRYAFLPFLYDDAAAALRQANNQFLGEGIAPYEAQSAP